MLGGRNLLDAAHKSVYGNELGGAQPLRIAAHRSHKESLKWVMAMLFAGEALLTWWFIFAFLIVPGMMASQKSEIFLSVIQSWVPSIWKFYESFPPHMAHCVWQGVRAYWHSI